MNKFRQGDAVKITGAAGSQIGTVEADTIPDELPDLPFPAPPRALAVAILKQWNVKRLLLISHPYTLIEEALFCAVTLDGNSWFDLCRHPLTIEAVPLCWECAACKALREKAAGRCYRCRSKQVRPFSRRAPEPVN